MNTLTKKIKNKIKNIDILDVACYFIIALILISVGYMIYKHGFDNGYHRG